MSDQTGQTSGARLAPESEQAIAPVPSTGNSELDALLWMAQAAQAAGAEDMEHLDGAAAAFNYIRIADLVAGLLRSNRIDPPILDWGCGYGQVSWLLQSRAVPVTSFDIARRPARDSIPILSRLSIQYGPDPVRLPFDSETFGGVLSVGVLEHVADLTGSLGELSRVLKPGGALFLFMLPNKFSWAEQLASIRGVSAHPHKYTFRQVSRMLARYGFHIERKWRRNFLPRNLTGFSQSVKRAYGRCYRQIEYLDRFLSNLPPTSLFSGVLEIMGRKGRG